MQPGHFFFEAYITHKHNNLNPAELFSKYLDTRTSQVRHARFVTFSAIDQHSDDAEFTETLTVSDPIVGRGIRESDVREFFGDHTDVIPICFGAKRWDQRVQDFFAN